MSALTPDQAAEVRAIVAEMIGQALQGSDERVRAASREVTLSLVPAIADGIYAQIAATNAQRRPSRPLAGSCR